MPTRPASANHPMARREMVGMTSPQTFQLPRYQPGRKLRRRPGIARRRIAAAKPTTRGPIPVGLSVIAGLLEADDVARRLAVLHRRVSAYEDHDGFTNERAGRKAEASTFAIEERLDRADDDVGHLAPEVARVVASGRARGRESGLDAGGTRAHAPAAYPRQHGPVAIRPGDDLSPVRCRTHRRRARRNPIAHPVDVARAIPSRFQRKATHDFLAGVHVNERALASGTRIEHRDSHEIPHRLSVVPRQRDRRRVRWAHDEAAARDRRERRRSIAVRDRGIDALAALVSGQFPDSPLGACPRHLESLRSEQRELGDETVEPAKPGCGGGGEDRDGAPTCEGSLHASCSSGCEVVPTRRRIARCASNTRAVDIATSAMSHADETTAAWPSLTKTPTRAVARARLR